MNGTGKRSHDGTTTIPARYRGGDRRLAARRLRGGRRRFGDADADPASSDADAGGGPSAADTDPTASPDAEPVLAVDGLRERDDDTVALDGVDLAVADGEFVAVVGPSGWGKSTPLRVLSGLEAEFAGRVAVDGTDVREGGSDDVGMVFKQPRPLDWADVRENVAVGLPAGWPGASLSRGGSRTTPLCSCSTSRSRRSTG